MSNTDFFREAKLMFAAGQLEQSIELFTRAYENGSDPAATFLNRGAAAMASSRFQEAEEDFSRVLAIDHEHERAHYFRGVARVALGNYNGAVEDLTFSLIRNNDRGIAHLLRGVAYAELGNGRDAALDINSAAAFSDAEQQSFKKLFGDIPSPFTHTKELLARKNAPWNNLLKRDAVHLLSNLLPES